MTTLKELVDNQELTNDSDIQIIKTFFILNNMEEEGVDLIYQLTKSKIQKVKAKQAIGEEWITRLPSEYLYENYNLKVANKLHKLELDYLIHGGELTNTWLKWAKENVSNIIRPECYFNPLVEWLVGKGIKFKKRKV